MPVPLTIIALDSFTFSVAGYFRPNRIDGQCRFCSNADRLGQQQAHRFLPLLQSRQGTVPDQQAVEGRSGTCASTGQCIHLNMPERIERYKK